MTNFWKGKKALITGATGLVGFWLTKAVLQRGGSVVAFVRDADPQSAFYRSGIFQETVIVQGALEEYASVERAVNEHEVDTVFHLGAQTIVGTALRSPLSTFESNIRGTYNLLEACRRLPSLVRRVVVASSDKAYGTSNTLPYTEGMPLGGCHPYDVSKSCADLLSFAYFHTYRLPVAVARCGNIFGGGDLNWSRLIPGTIRSFLFDQNPEIRSDGKYTRDYIFVEDVVDAYLLIAEQMHRSDVAGEAFNFGPGRPHSVIEIVEVLQRLMGCEDLPPLVLNQALSEIANQELSSAKAEHILDWQPRRSLEEGLRQTVAWYENYFAGQPYRPPLNSKAFGQSETRQNRSELCLRSD